MASGCHLTSSDNSLRNFVRWFYHFKRINKISLMEMIRAVKTFLMGDDSLVKSLFHIDETEFIVSSAHLGIITKGFTVPPGRSIAGHSFLGCRFDVQNFVPSFKWDIPKLLDSCRYRNGLSGDEFYEKIYTILILLSTDRDSFRMVKAAALQYFNRPIPKRKFFLRYYERRG